MTITVIHGDMLDELPKIEAESLDSCVCDPPYHLTSIGKRFSKTSLDDVTLTSQRSRDRSDGYARAASGFMGKQWDGGDIAFRVETWTEVMRVLKPGAYLLAFGGTRTFHRMACAIEDAGFEIRDTLCWLYGSGFPKSHDISKAIDRAAGAKRERIGTKVELGIRHNPGRENKTSPDYARPWRDDPEADGHWVTRPATDSARQWAGWGTALKPAYEPIIMARKTLGERTVAANALRHGVGAINVDACRIHAEDAKGGDYTVKRLKPGATLNETGGNWRPDDGPEYHGHLQPGRWPANVVHDGSDDVESAFAQFGRSGEKPRTLIRNGARAMDGWGLEAKSIGVVHGDSGTASRFFYTAKADAIDRLQSKHPTIKPVDLMRWLVRLVTPPGGTVLDCFAGSGTTGGAALMEGFNAVLIEREAEYIADIKHRLAYMEGPLFTRAEEGSIPEPSEGQRARDLFSEPEFP